MAKVIKMRKDTIGKANAPKAKITGFVKFTKKDKPGMMEIYDKTKPKKKLKITKVTKKS